MNASFSKLEENLSGKNVNSDFGKEYKTKPLKPKKRMFYFQPSQT